MKVKATDATWVTDKDGKDVLLQKGESAEVDGRKYNDDQVFMESGRLVVDEDKAAKKKQPAKKKQDDETQDEPEQDAGDSE